jgi:hypothetical protein
MTGTTAAVVLVETLRPSGVSLPKAVSFELSAQSANVESLQRPQIISIHNAVEFARYPTVQRARWESSEEFPQIEGGPHSLPRVDSEGRISIPFGTAVNGERASAGSADQFNCPARSRFSPENSMPQR